MPDWFDQHAPQQPQGGDWFTKNAPPQQASRPDSTHYDSLEPRKKSWWDEAVDTVEAGFRESSIGRAFHKDTFTEEAKKQDPRLQSDTFYRFGETHPERLIGSQVASAILPGVGLFGLLPDTVKRGVAKGAADFWTTMASPENVAIMAATMGLGNGPRAAQVLSRVISGGFSLQMIHGAAQQSPKLLQQLKAGDAEGATETITAMAAALGMGIAAGNHALTETPAAGMKPPPERKSSASTPKASATPSDMTPEQLKAWHEDFETKGAKAEGQEKSPHSGTEAGAPTGEKPQMKPLNTEKPGAVNDFMKDEEGSFNPRFMQESTEEMRAKYNMCKEGLKALEAAEASPMQKNWGQRAIEWFSGERNVWVARVNQEILRIKKYLPDRLAQEALSLYRDFKKRPGELQQFKDGTHPDLFHVGRGQQGPANIDSLERLKVAHPIIERALNPTPAMLRADAVLDRIAEVSLLTGQKLGILDSKLTPEEYVPHILHPRDLMNQAGGQYVSMGERLGQALGGKIARKIGAFAKERKAYPTLLHAIADGASPRTLNALDAFTVYSDKFATARATKLFTMKLKDAGVGKWSMSSDSVPEGWVRFAGHSNEFRNIVTIPGSDGMPTSAEQHLFVPDFVEKAFRPITDPDYTSRLPGFAPARAWQQMVKAASLSLSFFHIKAMTMMASANMNPLEAAKGMRADLESPEMEAQERDLILHTGTTDILGKTYEAYHHIRSTSIPTWDDILTSAPGIKQLHEVSAKITEATFGIAQRKWKIWDYATKKAAWIADHPNATAGELTAAKIWIARQINNVYGGLNWETLGWSRSMLQLTRALMLAPDWTISNFYNAKQVFEGGLKGNAGSNASRLFWIKAMAGGIAASQMMSLALTGKISPKLTQVYLGKDKKGNDILQNLFFTGAPGDLVNIMNKSAENGLAVGLAQWLAGKLAPGVRGFEQVSMNKTWRGTPVVPPGMDIRASTLRGAAHIARDVAPVPFSVQNVWDQAHGTQAEDTSPIEYLTAIIAGNPPQHRPPEGYKQTKGGLKPIQHKKPDQSWWDQTISGKVR